MFSVTDFLREFADRIISTIPDFQHIDQNQVIYAIGKSNPRKKSGTYAKLLPFRFAGGAETLMRYGQIYRYPALTMNGRNLLYAVVFMVPRFLDLTPEKKVLTVLHELYHISPEFNGDIRRLSKGKPAHGASRQAYNEYLKKSYLPKALNLAAQDEFQDLFLDYRALKKKYGRVFGDTLRAPQPQLIPESTS